MAHELAGALQQVSRIRQCCAVKEPHVYVRMEDIDVAEGRISQTCNRAAVMHSSRTSSPHFSHHAKPLVRDGPQFTCVLFHPRIDGGIPLDSAAAIPFSLLKAETTPGYWGGAVESEDAVVADPEAFADSPPAEEFEVRSRLADSFCCENSYFPS
jgi:hypothetical protein